MLFDFAPKFTSIWGPKRSVSGRNKNFGLRAENLIWERDKAIIDKNVNRVRVAMSRSTDNKLTVVEKKQFVMHKEEQIAAGIEFSGQDQVKHCVEHFESSPAAVNSADYGKAERSGSGSGFWEGDRVRV